MDRDNVICCSRRTAHAKNWFANQVQVQLKDMSSGAVIAIAFALLYYFVESRFRKSEQQFRVDKWSVCRG